MNTLFTVGDVDGTGRPDIVTSGRDGRMVWLQNDGSTGPWQVQLIDEVSAQECGGTLANLGPGPGMDLINGSDWRGTTLSWWENPRSEGGPWVRRVILDSGAHQFHDTLIAPLGAQGRLHLILTNQGRGGMGIVPIPDDPRQSPWPDVQWLVEGSAEKGHPDEGLCVLDADGDGELEIVFGVHWFKREVATWRRHRYAEGYVTTVLAAADVDGDGKPELIVSEGDPVIYGHPEGAKVAWFKPGGDPTEPWREHRLMEGLLDAHSLQAADLCGNGRQDLVVGEIGDAKRWDTHPPRLFLLENLGEGRFETHLIDSGTGVHHARLADFRGTGRLDIASRPLHGPEKWRVFVWFNEGF